MLRIFNGILLVLKFKPYDHLSMEADRKQNGKAAQTAEQSFPQWHDKIRQLRQRNSSFDEICRDLELLTQLFCEKSSTDDALSESIEGLKDEIKRALTNNSGSA